MCRSWVAKGSKRLRAKPQDRGGSTVGQLLCDAGLATWHLNGIWGNYNDLTVRPNPGNHSW